MWRRKRSNLFAHMPSSHPIARQWDTQHYHDRGDGGAAAANAAATAPRPGLRLPPFPPPRRLPPRGVPLPLPLPRRLPRPRPDPPARVSVDVDGLADDLGLDAA